MWGLRKCNWKNAFRIGSLAIFLLYMCLLLSNCPLPFGQTVTDNNDTEASQVMSDGTSSGEVVISSIPEAPLRNDIPLVSFVGVKSEDETDIREALGKENRVLQIAVNSETPETKADATQARNSANYTSPWSWTCANGEKCHRVRLQTSHYYVSLEACWLTCGTTRGLWPNPRRTDRENYLGKKTINFSLQNLRLGNVEGPSGRVKLLAVKAFDIMKMGLKSLFPTNFKGKQGTPATISVSIRINSSDDLISLLTNEKYRLRITQMQELNMKDATVKIAISAQTFFGARHGLETLSQLIVFDDATNSLQILSEVDLSDGPAFPYRGLMIDSGRNFIPIDSLKRMVDGMGQNKLNILHWHLSDSNSFPLFLPALPEMTNYGAYSKEEIYHPAHVQDFIEYARLRGVKVIPEIDVPAHVGNGWQWGNQANGYGRLALCVNEEPWNEKCGQPPCGQLNPANPKVYEVLGILYSHMLSLFDPDLFHMGGDEVRFTCWKTPEIQYFMDDNKIPDFMGLRTFFQNKAYAKLKIAAEKINSNSSKKELPPVPILWTSDLTAALSTLPDSQIMPTEYIIQTWEGIPSESKQVHELLKANFPLIISNVGHVYLDLGTGSWLGKGHDWRYINWQVLYDFDFDANGYDTTKRVFNSRFGEIPQILGGEAPLWTEKVNEVTLDGKLWPRGAAFGERLWLNPNPSENQSSTVYARLLHHNERMRRRGIRVDTRQPKSCLLINGNCENEMDLHP